MAALTSCQKWHGIESTLAEQAGTRSDFDAPAESAYVQARELKFGRGLGGLRAY
jgi:hypothetical protein